jgi:uncharacterized repeat protein (TIGR01451 family)
MELRLRRLVALVLLAAGILVSAPLSASAQITTDYQAEVTISPKPTVRVGDTVTGTVVVTNLGPDMVDENVVVQVTMSATPSTYITMTCAATGGVTCPFVSSVGYSAVAAYPNGFPVGATLTFTVTATAVADPGYEGIQLTSIIRGRYDYGFDTDVTVVDTEVPDGPTFGKVAPGGTGSDDGTSTGSSPVDAREGDGSGDGSSDPAPINDDDANQVTGRGSETCGRCN